MRAAGELGAVALMLAALITAFRAWLRSEPRPQPQHAARLTVDVAADIAAANAPPAGYRGEDTDTWLTRPAATGVYGQLAPGVLDAAAETVAPWAAPVTETAAERDAWVEGSLAADQSLEEPPLAPLPQLDYSTLPLARQCVWQPRPGPVQSGRHRAPELPAVEVAPEPQTAVDVDVAVAGPAEEPRPIDLPVIVWTQLGCRTPAQYVDDLFAGMVTHGA